MRALSLLLLFACTAEEPEAEATWYADVEPIVEASCIGCHEPGAIAANLDFTDPVAVAEMAPLIRNAVETRRMPPWGAGGDCNEYDDDLSLPDEDIEAIVAWERSGAVMGAEADRGDPKERWEPPVLDTVDLSIDMPEPYQPVGEPDDYRCFLMEWPYEESVWVTGFDVNAGNKESVHHVIPYIIAPSDAEAYRELDANDEGPGYRCFGGPGGDVQTLISTRWMGGWAPGVGAINFPGNTGVEMVPGSLIAMQVHYYVPGDGTAPDQSSIDVELSMEERPWGEIQPWTEVSWVLGVGMEIPGNSTDVTHAFEYESEYGFTLHSASMHMHNMGRSGRISVLHEDGTETCMLDIPEWDFGAQRPYRLVDPLVVSPGDTLRVECTWDNPTDRTVKWGDGTGDEMCLGITYMTD